MSTSYLLQFAIAMHVTGFPPSLCITQFKTYIITSLVMWYSKFCSFELTCAWRFWFSL